MRIYTKAWAKINLGLDVIGKLPNGYHLLETVYENLDLGDDMWLERGNKTVLTSNSMGLPKGSEIPLDETNLAYRAWQAMKDQFNLPGGLMIEIKKHIPISGGMGGGSADAAAVIWAANRLFELNLPVAEMQKIGLSLGADVPYLIQGGTIFAEGIGEKLTRLPRCPQCYVLTINMGFPVDTARVYQNLRWQEAKEKGFGPDMKGIIAGIKAQNMEAALACMGNVLEHSAFELYPALLELRRDLLDWGFTPVLSGSGGTMLGLTTDHVRAGRAYLTLSHKYPFVRFAHNVQKYDFQPQEGLHY